MKLTYLGTAAAEGFPALFCNCDYCTGARRLGGKNIRTRSQALINDDLLIDFPADTYSHFLGSNIEGDKIKHLLITHSHHDHFYPSDLKLHHGAYAHDMRTPVLEVFCGDGAYKKLQAKRDLKNISVSKLEMFAEAGIGKYTVIPLPARHAEGDGALIYIIKADRTILYAHDTGYFYDEVFDFIKDKNIVFDLVSLDCTNVDIPIIDEGNHMGLANIGRLIERLTGMGAVNSSTVKIINHFSHNACPLHHVLEEKVSKDGFLVSYDKMTVEI